jgi:hypothetical protein
MNILFNPLIADLGGLGENLNRLQFNVGMGFAVCGLILAFLPWKPKLIRWLSIGSALASIALVVYLVLPAVNTPPWQPILLLIPVILSFIAIGLSLRVLLQKPKR